MKNQIRFKKFLAMAITLGMVASIWATWGARPAQAIILIGGKTGLFGATAGQTVRVSILNAQARGIQPCVGVFDLSGNQIARYEATMPLVPGQGAFFDFDATSLGLRAGQRAQLRVEVELEQPPDPTLTQPPDPARPGDAIATVEVFNNDTGKTMYTMPLIFEKSRQ
jgi:hypothetical protein